MLHLFYHQLAKSSFYLRNGKRGSSGFEASLILVENASLPSIPPTRIRKYSWGTRPTAQELKN
jgi:hypothetical protein